MTADEGTEATGRWRLATRQGMASVLPDRPSAMFTVSMERLDGRWHEMDVESVALLRTLYDEMRPSDVALVIGDDEDGGALMRQIAGDHADPDAEPRRVGLH